VGLLAPFLAPAVPSIPRPELHGTDALVKLVVSRTAPVDRSTGRAKSQNRSATATGRSPSGNDRVQVAE